MALDYPKELFIELRGEQDFVGRLTVNKFSKNYGVEIDVVHRESKKIFRHVDILYGQISEEEATKNGLQRFADFLKSVK